MGVSFSASLTIGVPLSDLYGVEVKVGPVTRFNEKTGEPYIKNERMETHYWLNKPVSDNMIECYSSLAESIELEYLNHDSYSDNFDNGIIGLTITSTDNFETISLEQLTETMDKVKNIFAKYNMDVEPEIFLNREVH